MAKSIKRSQYAYRACSGKVDLNCVNNNTITSYGLTLLQLRFDSIYTDCQFTFYKLDKTKQLWVTGTGDSEWTLVESLDHGLNDPHYFQVRETVDE